MISCCTSLICLLAAVSCRLARHLLVCRNYSSWELIYSRLWHWVDLSHIAKIVFVVEMFASHMLNQTTGEVSLSRTPQTKWEWIWIKRRVWLKVSYAPNRSHVKPGNKWIIRSDSTADHALFTSNYGRRGVGEAPIWATSYEFSNDILKQNARLVWFVIMSLLKSSSLQPCPSSTPNMPNVTSTLSSNCGCMQHGKIIWLGNRATTEHTLMGGRLIPVSSLMFNIIWCMPSQYLCVHIQQRQELVVIQNDKLRSTASLETK